MPVITQAITLLLFVSVAMLAIIFSFFAVKILFTGDNVDFLGEGAASAFWGAAFAFLFIRLGEWSNAHRRNMQNRFDAVVRLSQLDNEYLNTLTAYEARLKEFVESLEMACSKNRPHISLKLLIPLHIHPEMSAIYGLGHHDLGNETYRIFTRIRHIENDSKDLSDTYDRSIQMFLESSKSPQSFVDNCAVLLVDAKKHHEAVTSAITKLKSALASARCVGQLKAKYMFPFRFLNAGEYSRSHVAKVAIELQRMEAEFEKNKKL